MPPIRRSASKARGRPSEVFLSHATRDRRFILRLSAVLNRHGIPTWYAEEDINAEQWHDEIGRALARCDWFVVALTPQAVRSRWVKEELLYALRENSYRDRVIPLLVRDCNLNKLSWTLLNRQFVDFRDEFEEGCRALLRRWGVGYRPE